MKTLLKRSVSLWLSLAVLLGSVGLTVSQHICLTSGKVMVSFEQKEDPCTKGHGQTDCEIPDGQLAFKKKCCEFKLDLHKLEQAAQLKLTQLSFVWIAPDITFSPVFPTVSQTRQEVFLYANSSPPLYGKDLLYSLHVLRV
ncbi:MAG TPA: hypothetical protein VK927_11270 [Adhaeribacter sp.]|nr:hypothetical protein [Adhaeribacter sp.]